jgi:hypothetical protein
MSTLLLPELARESAASNRRLARSVEDLRQREEVQPTLPQAGTGSAREALRYTLFRAAEASSLWQGTVALFQDGLDGHEARDVLQAVLEVFDSWFGLVKSTRDLWHTTDPTGASPEGLEELDAVSRDIELLKTAAEEMRTFLNRSRPPVDAAVLEKARQAVVQGRYKTPEAVRARLHDPQA